MKRREEEPIPELRTHTETPETMINPTSPTTSTKLKANKMRDVYIKIHNASDTMHTDQTGCFPPNIQHRKQIHLPIQVGAAMISEELSIRYFQIAVPKSFRSQSLQKHQASNPAEARKRQNAPRIETDDKSFKPKVQL